MELLQWKYFVAAYEEKSFRGAANKLYVSHQALGRAIHNLEQEIGGYLFTVKNQNITPTPLAHRAYELAVTIIGSFDSFEQDIKGMAKEQGLNMKVAVSPAAYSLPIYDWIHNFSKINPIYKITIIDGDDYSVLKAIREGSADIGILHMATEKVYDLYWEKLIQITGYLLVHKDNHLADRTAIAIEDLLTQQMIAMSSKYQIYYKLMEIFSNKHLPFKPAHIIDNPIIAHDMVAKNQGVIVTSQTLMTNPIPEDTVLIPFYPEEVMWEVIITMSKNKRENSPEKQLIKYLKLCLDAIIGY